MVRTALLGFILLTFAPGWLSAGCGSYVEGEVPGWIRRVTVEDEGGISTRLGVFLHTFDFVMHKSKKMVNSAAVNFKGSVTIGTNPATCSGSKVSTFSLNGDVFDYDSKIQIELAISEPVCLPADDVKPLEETLMVAKNDKNGIRFDEIKCSSTDVQHELICEGVSQVGAPITIFDDKGSRHTLVGFVEKVGSCSQKVQLLDSGTLACLRKGFGCGRWDGVGKTPWATSLDAGKGGGLPGLIIISPKIALSWNVPDTFPQADLEVFDDGYSATRLRSCGNLDVWKVEKVLSDAPEREPVCLPKFPSREINYLLMKRDGSAARTECDQVTSGGDKYFRCTMDNSRKNEYDLNQPLMNLKHVLLGFFTGKTSPSRPDTSIQFDVRPIQDAEWVCITKLKLNNP